MCVRTSDMGQSWIPAHHKFHRWPSVQSTHPSVVNRPCAWHSFICAGMRRDHKGPRTACRRTWPHHGYDRPQELRHHQPLIPRLAEYLHGKCSTVIHEAPQISLLWARHDQTLSQRAHRQCHGRQKKRTSLIMMNITHVLTHVLTFGRGSFIEYHSPGGMICDSFFILRSLR